MASALSESILEVRRQDIERLIMTLPCGLGGRHAYLRAWRAFFYWLEDIELIEKNPCRRVRVKVPKPLRYAVNVGDIPVLIGACASTRGALIISMLADTGLRQSELARIKVCDINQEDQTIIVWGKGAKQRKVRYGPRTGQLLDAWLKERTEILGTDLSLLGLLPRGIAMFLYRLGRTSGIKCNAHAFRRTFACESVRNGMNIFFLQSLLGHSTLTMTRIYAEQVNSEDAIKAYKPIVV